MIDSSQLSNPPSGPYNPNNSQSRYTRLPSPLLDDDNYPSENPNQFNAKATPKKSKSPLFRRRRPSPNKSPHKHKQNMNEGQDKSGLGKKRRGDKAKDKPYTELAEVVGLVSLVPKVTRITPTRPVNI